VALIDRYLDALSKHRADALLLRAGAAAEMVIGGAPRPASARPVSEDQIVGLLSDALGAAYAPGVSGKRTYPYQSPFGAVSLQVEDNHAGLSVRIVLAPGSATTPAPIVLGLTPSAPIAHAPSGPIALDPAEAPVAPSPRKPSVQVAAVGAAAAPAARASAVASPAARVSVVVAGPPKHMDELFHQMLDLKASDMHLKSTKGPNLRIDGSMTPMPGRPALAPAELEALLAPIFPERNRIEFAETNDTDFAYELPGRARMRCNVFRDIAGVGAVFRQIPTKILTVDDLKLPKACIDFCGFDKGLVVVTGPTGSGKSTTLAAMIDWINTNRDDHIITIEDPVEFVHKDKKCLINQREVGTQTRGFKSALRAALREDPDIVLVGEMRDLETVAIAIETAETGHLVFGTLHTNTAPSTVDRLIDQFPTDRQSQIRMMLAESLKGVVAQILLKKKGGGRIAALEILVVTPAVSNLIREGKTYQIPSMMQTGRALGMQTLNDALLDLVKNDIVEPQEAYDRAPQKKEFGIVLSRAGLKGPWTEEKPS
jgi:twitching motility protein PilT